MHELFIYYRIASAGVSEARTAVLAFQARLREHHPGLVTQLYTRSDDSMDTETWMETYALRRPDGRGGVDTALREEIEAVAACLAPFLRGVRHTEVFIPCVS